LPVPTSEPNAGIAGSAWFSITEGIRVGFVAI
jgi:hypothetical protein